MLSIRLKITIAILISPIILILFFSTLINAACTVTGISNVTYNKYGGAICQGFGRVHPNQQKFLIYFGTDMGCDRAYEYNVSNDDVVIYRGINNQAWSINMWASSPNSMPGFRTDASAWSRMMNNGASWVSWFEGGNWKVLKNNAWPIRSTGTYTTTGIEDGGDGWPNVPRCAPGSPAFNFYDPSGCGWGNSNLDGDVSFRVNITCTCSVAPPFNIGGLSPADGAVEVPLGAQNDVTVSFTDTGGLGDSTCMTSYAAWLYEDATNTQVGYYPLGTVRSFRGLNLKAGTRYRWRVRKFSFPNSVANNQYRPSATTWYYFTTEIQETYPLVTLDAPSSFNSLQNFTAATKNVQLNINTNGTTGVKILGLNSIPYFSNTFGIVKQNLRYTGLSKLNALLSNYDDSNPNMNSTLGIYDFLLQRAQKKTGDSGGKVVDYLNATKANAVRSGTTITGNINKATFSTGILDTSAQAVALIYGNPIYPTSLTNQKVILSSTVCQDNIAHFISGDLVIHPHMINSATNRFSKCMYIVKGDLIVEPGVNSTTAATSDYDIVEGYFIVEGETFIKSDTGGDGIIFNGGLVTKQITNLATNGAPVTGTTGLGRDLNTLQKPSHIIKYDPAYPIVFRDLFGSREYSLREK